MKRFVILSVLLALLARPALAQQWRPATGPGPCPVTVNCADFYHARAALRVVEYRLRNAQVSGKPVEFYSAVAEGEQLAQGYDLRLGYANESWMGHKAQ